MAINQIALNARALILLMDLVHLRDKRLNKLIKNLKYYNKVQGTILV